MTEHEVHLLSVGTAASSHSARRPERLMRAAAAALWRAMVDAAAAGTLARSVGCALSFATWALDHPDDFSMLLGVARSLGFGAELLASGGSAAVESPAMSRADGSHMGGA